MQRLQKSNLEKMTPKELLIELILLMNRMQEDNAKVVAETKAIREMLDKCIYKYEGHDCLGALVLSF